MKEKSEADQEALQDFLRERSRSLAEQARSAVLGTMDDEGYPYTSLVEVVFDGQGNFWLLLSNLAVHTRNIRRDGRASLLIRDEEEEQGQELASTRGCYVGRLVEADEERKEIESLYLEAQPHAERFVDFGDFRFYKFRLERVRLIAGFGRIGWVPVDEMIR